MIDAKLFLNQDMGAESEVYPFAAGQVAIYSSRAPEKNTENEDCAASFLVAERAGVLAVADGMGGMPMGGQASSVAVKSLQSALGKLEMHGNGFREAVLNGIETANTSIGALGVGAATTLAAVEVHGQVIRPYHIGDSMILVVGQKGKIKLQTISHSPVGYAVEAGFLDEQQAMHHEERHLVSNMIGTANMRIEVGPQIELAAKDTLLIASDGLSDNFQVDEIVERIRKGQLAKVMNALIRETHERMQHPTTEQPSKPDDLTIVLYRRLA
jgi:serine/threonine protein phosphatase PrpC